MVGMADSECATVLVVQNQPGGGPRRFGEWLTEDGLKLDIVSGHQGRMPPSTVQHHDAVLVLGGGFLPDDDARAPWLAPTRGLVRDALDTGTPVLGICLGAQLLALVAGGVVEGDVGAPEAGSTPIRRRDAADGDPLFGALPDRFPAIEHHVDAITKLPTDAVWLAESDRCPIQGFRVGATAWGTQFHPEVTPDRLLGWDRDRLIGQGFDPEELCATAIADEPVSTPLWRGMAARFAAVVRDRAGR